MREEGNRTPHAFSVTMPTRRIYAPSHRLYRRNLISLLSRAVYPAVIPYGKGARCTPFCWTPEPSAHPRAFAHMRVGVYFHATEVISFQGWSWLLANRLRSLESRARVHALSGTVFSMHLAPYHAMLKPTAFRMISRGLIVVQQDTSVGRIRALLGLAWWLTRLHHGVSRGVTVAQTRASYVSLTLRVRD